MTGLEQRHPQEAYNVLQKYLQQEWALVQRVTQGLGEYFVPVEKDLHEELLLTLFHGAEVHTLV